MNKFIEAIKDLDLAAVTDIIDREPKWLDWSEPDGKNALHFLCGVPMVEVSRGNDGRPVERPSPNQKKADISLRILKLLLDRGMDINSIHLIADKNCGFPARPLWWAYTRGHNETIWKYLLKQGVDPQGCMYAITWYDDAKAAEIFRRYGAEIEGSSGMDSPLLAAFTWKKWKMAGWLLKNGAKVDATDNRGNTALFHAVRKKYDPAHIKLLLKYGADRDKANNQDVTPRDIASRYRDKTILNLFS